MTSGVRIKVLGTAQDAGVPHPNCSCSNCIAAKDNPDKRRYAASLAIIFPDYNSWHLIDATPDIREQMDMVVSSFPNMGMVSSIILTHAHIGHYTGLMFLGKEAISSKNLPVYAGEKMSEFLRKNAPWNQLIHLKNIKVKEFKQDNEFTIESHTSTKVKVTPIEVPHRNEYSETYGFLITGEKKKLLYIPDIDRWEKFTKDIVKVATMADICLLDATFYSANEISSFGRDYNEIPHPLIEDTMDLLQGLVDEKQTKVFFTHFNHTNPVIKNSTDAYENIIKRGFHILEEEMEFDI